MSGICARCPKIMGVSCCQVPPGARLATLTDADVTRIAEATGRSPGTFVDEEWLTEQEAQEYEDARPLYRGYFRASTRRLTLKARRGACVFFDPREGCGLSAAARPLACRLFPFDVGPTGGWSIQPQRFGDLEAARGSAEGCLAVEESDGMDELRLAFDYSVEALEALAAQVREEVSVHAKGRARTAVQRST